MSYVRVEREPFGKVPPSQIEMVRKGLKANVSYTLISLHDTLGENSHVLRPPLYRWKETKISVGILVTIAAISAIVIFSLNAHNLISKSNIFEALIAGVIVEMVVSLHMIIRAAWENRKLDQKRVEELLILEENHL